MDRAARRVFLGLAAWALLSVTTGSAWAERRSHDDDEEDGLKRVLVMPLLGPSGIGARNAIAKRIEARADVVTIGRRQSRRPVRVARREGADLMVGGRIQCPAARCKVQVIVYRRSGRIWRKVTKRIRRRDVQEGAADLAENLLTEMELLYEGEIGEDEPTEDEEVEQASDQGEEEEWFMTSGDEDPRPEPDIEQERDPDRRRRPPRPPGEARFKAVEIYLALMDLTLLRNLCVDTVNDPEDSACSLTEPQADDRTYTVTPFDSMGGRFILFPGAFLREQPWWAHIGLYADYVHSLAVSSQRQYETAIGESFTVKIGTSQQEARVGLMGRIPLMGPGDPQLRVFAGYGLYEFALDDTAYPEDSEVSRRYQDSNPYLPTFSYHTMDLGLRLQWPFLDGLLLPYVSIAYRLGLSAGQAGSVYATDTAINGVQSEFGLMVEIPLGFRFAADMNVVYFNTSYAGDVDWSVDPLATWAGTISGQESSDTVFRFRLWAGWSF